MLLAAVILANLSMNTWHRTDPQRCSMGKSFETAVQDFPQAGHHSLQIK